MTMCVLISNNRLNLADWLRNQSIEVFEHGLPDNNTPVEPLAGHNLVVDSCDTGFVGLDIVIAAASVTVVRFSDGGWMWDNTIVPMREKIPFKVSLRPPTNMVVTQLTGRPSKDGEVIWGADRIAHSPDLPITPNSTIRDLEKLIEAGAVILVDDENGHWKPF